MRTHIVECPNANISIVYLSVGYIYVQISMVHMKFHFMEITGSYNSFKNRLHKNNLNKCY